MNQPTPMIEEPVPAHSRDPEDCISKFFHALHDSDHLPGFLNVWTLPDKKSCFFRQQPYRTLAAKKCRELAHRPTTSILESVCCGKPCLRTGGDALKM